MGRLRHWRIDPCSDFSSLAFPAKPPFQRLLWVPSPVPAGGTSAISGNDEKIKQQKFLTSVPTKPASLLSLTNMSCQSLLPTTITNTVHISEIEFFNKNNRFQPIVGNGNMILI